MNEPQAPGRVVLVEARVEELAGCLDHPVPAMRKRAGSTTMERRSSFEALIDS